MTAPKDINYIATCEYGECRLSESKNKLNKEWRQHITETDLKDILQHHLEVTYGFLISFPDQKSANEALMEVGKDTEKRIKDLLIKGE